MDILSAAAGGAGSLISSIGGLITRNSDRKFQQRLMREQNNFNAQEAEKSYQRQVEMFNMQNQYNSPANQRQLYQAAGFNPNLAMSGSAGTAAATGASSAPQASSGTAPDVRSQNPMAALGDFAGIVSSLSQAKLNESKANNLNSQTQGQDLNNRYQTFINELQQKYGEKDFLSQMHNRDYQTAMYDSQTALNDALRDGQKITNQLSDFELKYMSPAQLGVFVADEQLKIIQADLARADAAKSRAEAEEIYRLLPLKLQYIAAGIWELRTQAMMNMSSARLNNANSALLEEGGYLSDLYKWQGTTESWLSESAMYDAKSKGLEFDFQNKQFEKFGDTWLRQLELQLENNDNELRLEQDYYRYIWKGGDGFGRPKSIRHLLRLFGPGSGSSLIKSVLSPSIRVNNFYNRK